MGNISTFLFERDVSISTHRWSIVYGNIDGNKN